MERDIDKLVSIPGELKSVAMGHVVAATENVYDYDNSMYLNLINNIALETKGTSDETVQRVNSHNNLLTNLLRIVDTLDSVVNFSPQAVEVLNELRSILQNDSDLATAVMELIALLHLEMPHLVHITKDLYEALTTELKNNGNWYFIEEDE